MEEFDHGRISQMAEDRRSRWASSLRGLPWAAFAAFLVAVPVQAFACDLCAIYTATETSESQRGLRLGVAQQFTYFSTLQQSGDEVANVDHERLDSSVTQILLGYNFNHRFGLQLNLPIVARTYRRREASGIQHGDETGFGDLSLLGNARLYSWYSENSVLRLSALAGLKLPSGDSSRLGEEASETTTAVKGRCAANDSYCQAQQPASLAATGPVRADHSGGTFQSGIHGHDLALGSGSVDGILGAQLFFSWHKLFWSSSVQYAIRSEGDFNYQYANDLLWNGGPGMFVALGHDLANRDYSVSAQAVLSGETKGNDTMNGEKANDTAITALYIGPGLAFTWGTSLAVDIGADLPVLQNNSSLQIVPDYRLRGGVTWRF
jgi:hypothetical protein